MDIQGRMAEADRQHDPDIAFRIGINVGDIILDGGDIFGDGVNVAARVENECEPGGVYLSDDAFRQVRGKTGFVFDDMGERALKNIDRPVRVYAVRGPEVDVASPTPATQTGKDGKGAVAGRDEHPSLPDKPSIAVLPFQNMSGDPEQEYFADGIVEDIITALSRFKSLFAIARNSSFPTRARRWTSNRSGASSASGTYSKGVCARRATGSGSPDSSSRPRPTTISGPTSSTVPSRDIFDLQDQVTAKVVGLIAPALEQAEIDRARRKPTERLDAYDLYLRGVALLRTRDSLRAARVLFAEAVQKDPEYGAAHAMLAWTILTEQSTTGVPLSPERRAEAVDLAAKAEKLAGGDAFALARAGHVFAYLACEYDRGASLTAEAVALNPNLAAAWYSRGWVSLLGGEPKRAIESFDRMLRLSPLDPLRTTAWNGRAFALFLLDRFAEGCESATKAVQAFKDVHSLGALLLNCVGANRAEEAREAAAALLQAQPGFRASRSIEVFPVRSPAFRDRILQTLRDAGLPP